MSKNDQAFIKKYFYLLKSSLNLSDAERDQIIEIKKLILKTKLKKSKIIIFGNGGSSAIASHFTVDMVKNSNIECLNFNEYDFITCLANDYGFDNWVKKALEFYLKKGDIVILISSSGKSKNMINAGKYVKKKGNKLITFTGFNKNNALKKLGDFNFWVNSKIYNIVENSHQILLLLINDLTSLKLKNLK